MHSHGLAGGHEVFPFLIIIITVCYLIIAWQFWFHSRDNDIDQKGRRAILYLMGIFLLCDLSGYVSVLFPPGETRALVRNASHFLLAIVSCAYIMSAQPAVIMKLFTRHD